MPLTDDQEKNLKKIVSQWDNFWKSIPDNRKQRYNR
mgnify:FL=1